MNLKKILALVLVFTMVLSFVPTYAFAEDEGIELFEEEVFEEAAPEEGIVEEDPQDEEPIVEITDETDTEPAAEPAAEDTSAEPAGEEVSEEEPAPTEGEPAEKPEEEEEELEAVTSTVEDTETLEAVPVAMIGTNDYYASLEEAVTSAANDGTVTITVIAGEGVPVTAPANWKNANIDLDGRTLSGEVLVTSTSLVNVTISNGTIADDVTVKQAALTLDGIDFAYGATLTLDDNSARATLTNVAMGDRTNAISVTNGFLAIESGTYAGDVTADNAGKGKVTGGTFGYIKKSLIMPGYTTPDYSSNADSSLYCSGEVTKETAKTQVITIAGKGKYFDTAEAAFTATLDATGTWSGGTIVLTAAYNETAEGKFALADNAQLNVFKDDAGYGLALADSLEPATAGYLIQKNVANNIITYSVNTDSEARIGTQGYTFRDAVALAVADPALLVEVLGTPSNLTQQDIQLGKNEYVQVKIINEHIDIATLTSLFKTKQTSGYSITAVEVDAENKLYTIKNVANNYSIGSGEDIKYFDTLNDAIASVKTTRTNVTIKAEITTDIASAKIDEGKKITLDLNGKNVKLLNGAIAVEKGAIFTITGSTTFGMEDTAATFTIADGAAVTINAPVVAQDIAKLATISGAGKLTLGGTVTMTGDAAIEADPASFITIDAKFTATLTGTGTAFKGGRYTINDAVDIDNAGVGFENVNANVKAKVEIEATDIGVRNSNLQIINEQSASGALNPGKGFDLLATNTIITHGDNAKLATTTGLTAYVKNSTTSTTTYYARFAKAAAIAEKATPTDTVVLLAEPASGDVHTFTDAAFKLKVQAAPTSGIATTYDYTKLVVAYSDSTKPPKAILDNCTNNVHELSQEEIAVELRNKSDNTVVGRFTNFENALKAEYTTDQYFYIANSDGAVTGVTIPYETHPEIYLKKASLATSGDLENAEPTANYQFAMGSDGSAAPYKDGSYYVYKQEPKDVQITWSANGGTWTDLATNTQFETKKFGESVTTGFTPEPKQQGQFFKGWALNQNATPSDLNPFPITVTTPTTFYAQWTPAVATLTDLGGYGYNFGSVREAYEFLTAPEHADWFKTSVITLIGNAGVVYLDDFVPTGESLKLKKGNFTADVKLRNQKVPSATSLVPYEADTYTFVTTSTDVPGVTTYTVGQYTAQLETVVSESTKGNNGNWSDFQVTSTSYKIIKDFNDLASKNVDYVTKKDVETSQKKTRTEKTIIFLTDNPATRTDLDENWFAATGTKLRVDPNGHKDNFNVPTGECITKTNLSGVDVYTWATYTVTLDGNGGTPATQPVTVRAKEKVTTWTNVTKHGYTWTAWATSTDKAAAEIDPATTAITKDQTWVAKWTPVDVTYTFVATATDFNVTTQTKISGKFDTEVGTGTNLAAINGVKTYMADEGFTVTGWTLNGDTVEQPTTFTYTGTNTNVTYVATLEPIEFQVEFDANGGTPVPATQRVKMAVGHVATGTDAGYATPTKIHNTFLGWTTDSNLATSTNANDFKKAEQIPITTDTKLYAGWNPDTITFKFVTSPTEIYPTGVTATGKYGTALSTTTDLKEIATMTNAIKDKGYDFLGWKLDGKGETIQTPESFDCAVGTTTNLYVAELTEKTYTIVFNGNGGLIDGKQTVSESGLRSTKTNLKVATTTDALSYTAVRGNYDFVGWATRSDLTTPTTVEITDKTFYEVCKDSQNGTVTYYAVYTPGLVNLTFKYGYSEATPTEVKVQVRAGATRTDILNAYATEAGAATPTRVGYVFDKWSPEVTTAQVDATYTAQWLKTMDVAIMVDAYTIFTYQNVAVGSTLTANEAVNSVKFGTQPAKWLINGDETRYFEFGTTPVPADLEYLLATSVDPTTTVTITFTSNDRTEILQQETITGGTKPQYKGNTPTWLGDSDGKLHIFKGWKPNGSGNTVYNNVASDGVSEFPVANADIIYVAYFEEQTHNETYLRSLSLSDSIAFNWKIGQAPSGADKSKYKATVEYKGSTTHTYEGEELFTGVQLAACIAQEMTEEIKVNVWYGEDLIAEDLIYTVAGYCDDMLKEQGMSAWHNLMKALEHYGNKAQLYYGSSNPLPANGDFADKAFGTGEDVVALTRTAKSDIAISQVQFRLLTEAQTVLSVGFVHASGKTFNDYDFTLVRDGQTKTLAASDVNDNGAMFEIKVEGIAAKDLNKQINIYVSPKGDSTKRAIFEGSPASYMKYVAELNNPNATAALKAMLRAMYTYHVYAKNPAA